MSAVDLYVGSYAEAGGKGLYWLTCDAKAGLTLGKPICDITNASFGAWSGRHGLHYLVNEQAMGAVGAYRLGGDAPARVTGMPSEGREPCYVALDANEHRLAVANYGSGSIAAWTLNEDGLPTDGPAMWANAGGGPNAERQDGPHIHCVRFSPDGAYLYATDLGTDQLLRFPMQAGPKLEEVEIVWKAPPGAGPRHLLFHPHAPIALLVCEMASTVTLFDVSAAGVAERETRSTLPEDASEESLGGDLAINPAGDRVYVTNRGHDSIAVFALDAVNGTLKPLQHVASGGASPRSLLLLEATAQMLVVNEEAGNVVQFAIAAGGELIPAGSRVDIPGAAFIFPVRA